MTEHFENLSFNINRLKWSNKLDHQIFADILRVTRSELEDIQFARNAPSLETIIGISEYFKIKLTDLVNSKISIHQAVLNKSTYQRVLPEKYAVAANSKVRTSYHVINYLEKKKKFGLIEQFLEKTGVPYGIFSDLTNDINIEFISDLCTWLKDNRLVSHKDLYQMGLNTYEVNKNTEMTKTLNSFKSLKEMYIYQLNEAMNFFDKNAHYRVVKASDTQCKVAWTHNPEVCDGLKKKVLSNLSVETYQIGVAASLPLFLNLPSSQVKMVSSLQVDDKETALEIDFSHAYEVLKQRNRLRLHRTT